MLYPYFSCPSPHLLNTEFRYIIILGVPQNARKKNFIKNNSKKMLLNLVVNSDNTLDRSSQCASDDFPKHYGIGG